MSTHYATYFDRHFLTRGVALIESIDRYCSNSTIWVLCLDDETYEIIEQLSFSCVRAMHLRDLEEYDGDLLRTKKTRSTLEYYYTLTAPFLRFIFALNNDMDLLVYVDADHYFFRGPLPLINEMTGYNIGIIDHRYPERLSQKYVYGRYNVGIIAFRRSPVSDACIARWRDQCIEWCYDRLEVNRYGDQRYLEEWPESYPGVRILTHPGIGTAVWNITNYAVTFNGSDVFIDGSPLVAYHFSSFRILSQRLFDMGTRYYGFQPSSAVRRGIYARYARAISCASQRIADLKINDRRDTVRPQTDRMVWTRGSVLLERLHVLGASLFHRSLLLVTNRLTLSMGSYLLGAVEWATTGLPQTSGLGIVEMLVPADFE